MKILFLSPYVYDSRYPEHRRNKTGFGMMVADIANSLCGRGNEVYVLTHAFGPKREDGLRHICRHRPTDVLLHIKLRGLAFDLLGIARLPERARLKMRYAYYRLDRGYVLNRIKAIRPDIVHIHGIGTSTINYIEACRELKVPYIVTAHGLLAGDPGAAGRDKALERDFFRQSERERTPVTVISSGIKRRLTGEGYGLKSARNVTVVPNGTRRGPGERAEDTRAAAGAGTGDKICVSVGSVCKRKDQMRTVRAFALLPEEIRAHTLLIIIGKIADGCPIKDEIKRLGLSDRVRLTGFADEKELSNYYAAADLNILASIDEGFGLSVIEGFVYGVPCVTFSDLDAVPDLYDAGAMALCRERTDAAFSEAIRSALLRDWDRNAVRAYGARFSLDSMAEKYLKAYSGAIRDFDLNASEGAANG